MPSRKRKQEPQEQWFVEVLMKARRTGVQHLKNTAIVSSPAWEYYVQWAGFPEAENTWQQAADLSSCERLIRSFWDEVGHEAFLTNLPGFEVAPRKEWIVQEKLRFYRVTPLDEIKRQNENPTRKRSRSRSTPRTPSVPSTPRQSDNSPRKVAFAPLADVSFIPLISDVENIAQYHRTTRKPLAEPSDSEDDVSIAVSANTSPTTGIKLRVPRPRPAPRASILLTSSDTDLPQTNEADELPETPSRNPLFSPPPRPLSRTIKVYEPPFVSPGSKLATKQRLATASVARGIPRASPDPALAPTPSQSADDDTIDVDSGPTLIPNTDADPVEGLNPMLAPYNEDDFTGTSASAGLYGADEDRYAGLPRNGESMDMDIDTDFGDGGGLAGNLDPVDQFLNSIELPERPRTPIGDERPRTPIGDYRPARPRHAPAPVKKWSWTGRLTITVAGRVQTVCERAILTDATTADKPDRPRIPSFVPSRKDLNFPVFHDIYDVVMFLPYCKSIQQFARLTATEGPDGESFKILQQYMSRKEQAVILPALWDDEKVIGYLIVLPPTAQALVGYLRVPSDLRAPGSLIAALALLQKEGNEILPLPDLHWRHFPNEHPTRTTPVLLSPAQWRTSLALEPRWHLSLRILKLPPHIQKFAYAHASVVWFARASDDDVPDDDTKHLRRVLEKCKPGARAGVVPPNEDSAQLVFVHVAALANIHKLPLLAQRRGRQGVHFYLYGTHTALPRHRWGFREIYKLGGIVTFTPEALVRDAWGVLRTIRAVADHPLWACYLLPQVVGMAVRLNECREDESMEDYTGSLPFVFDLIFDAILAGKVALMRTPASDASPKDIDQWLRDYTLFHPFTKHAVLQCCANAFDATYSSSGQSTWATSARKDVLADMRHVQVHPAFVEEYRRFVVLDASADPQRHDGEDGIEWHAVGKFEFQDGKLDGCDLCFPQAPQEMSL